MNAASLGHALDNGFAWTWHTSLYASVLIVLVWVVQWLLGKRLSPGWRCAFGILVVVRLLIPATPATHFSVFNVTRSVFRPEPRPATPPIQIAQVPTFQPPTAHEVVLPNTPEPPHRRFSIKAAIELAWLAGCAGILFVALAQQLRMAAWARRQKPVSDPRAVALLQSCRRQIRLRRGVQIVIAPQLGTPAVFGFFKPCLLLPEGILERQNAPELRLIFLHELAHIRRGDVLFNWFVVVARSLHWFNPLAWLALNRFRADQELACDAGVLAHLTMDERRLYGNTLLNLLAQHFRVPNFPGLVPLIHKKSGIERRIRMITSFQPARRSASLASAAAFLVISSLTLTRAANQNSSPPPEPLILTADDSAPSPKPLTVGERPRLIGQPHGEERSDIEKDIPLSEAIRRANEQFPDAQPLTEEELVAAVSAIKLKHPDIKEEVYETYMRVVRERVLPKEMYFSQIKGWNTEYGRFKVYWINLILRGRLATVEETKSIEAKMKGTNTPGNGYIVTFSGPLRVDGFGYRIRDRFISIDSSTPPRVTPLTRPTPAGTLRVEVYQDGSLRIDYPNGETTEVTLDQLKGIFLEQMKSDPETFITIAVNRSNTTGNATKVIDAAHAANLTNVRVQVSEGPFALMNQIGGSRITAAETQIRSFSTALELFEVDNGKYPNGPNGLLQLVQRPRNAQAWNGPYLSGIPKDPWQNDYIYIYPGKFHPDGYDVISMGPDGQLGTSDDIMNLPSAK